MDWIAKKFAKRKVQQVHDQIFMDSPSPPSGPPPIIEKICESGEQLKRNTTNSSKNAYRKSVNWWKNGSSGVCQFQRGSRVCTIKSKKKSKYCLIHECRTTDCHESRAQVIDGYCPKHLPSSS